MNVLRPLSQFLSVLPKTCSAPALTNVGGVFEVTSRNVIRVHFPRPNEVKRVRRHGWFKRLSTPGGRKVLMNRILKGRHVYSH